MILTGRRQKTMDRKNDFNEVSSKNALRVFYHFHMYIKCILFLFALLMLLINFEARKSGIKC